MKYSIVLATATSAGAFTVPPSTATSRSALKSEGRQKLVGTATEHWTPAKGIYNTVVSTARCESLTGVGSQQFVDALR